MTPIVADYTPELVHDAVSRGADWLYEKCPDWLREIDLSRLDLSSRTECTLGQTAACLTGEPGIYSGYSRVLEHFNKGTDWSINHGFEVPQQHPYNSLVCTIACHSEVQARYEMLTIAWLEYIRSRLDEMAVSA